MRRLLLLSAILSLSACGDLLVMPPHDSLTGLWEGSGDGTRVSLSMIERPGDPNRTVGSFLEGRGTLTSVATGESITLDLIGFYGRQGVEITFAVVKPSGNQGQVDLTYYGIFNGEVGANGAIIGTVDGSRGDMVGPFASRTKPPAAITFTRQ